MTYQEDNYATNAGFTNLANPPSLRNTTDAGFADLDKTQPVIDMQRELAGIEVFLGERIRQGDIEGVKSGLRRRLTLLQQNIWNPAYTAAKALRNEISSPRLARQERQWLEDRLPDAELAETKAGEGYEAHIFYCAEQMAKVMAVIAGKQ